MNSSRVQEIHTALVIHFTSEKYNFLQYNGKLKNKKPTVFSDKLAKRLKEEKDAVTFFVANQVEYFKENQKVNTFIGTFCTHEALNVMVKDQAYLENYSYFLVGEAKTLISLGEKIKDFREICNLLLNGVVSYRTAINFMVHLNMYALWETDDPLLEKILAFLKKLSDFQLIPKKNFVKAILTAKSELN